LADEVAVSGSYAYVADGGGLRVIDISTRSDPREVGHYNTPTWAEGVAVLGSHAYATDKEEGLRVVDISNPSNPTEVGYYDTPGSADGVAISGSYAYVADGESGLQIYRNLLVGIEEETNRQLTMSNGQLSVHPNPFTHNTVVEFVVRLPALPIGREQAGGSQPEADEPRAQEFVDKELVTLDIHDAAGRLVKTLVNEEKGPGRHEVSWNAKGVHSQDGCATGIYFARLAVGKDHRETKKLILVR
jgi:hypothetical protein